MAIEQGRCAGISIPALHRLAAALELCATDRRVLFELAGHPLTGESEAGDQALTADAIARISNSIRGLGSPAFALDEIWNAVSWNAQAEALFPGWLGEGRDHNLLRFAFLDLDARRTFHPWLDWASGLVGDFQAFGGELSMPQAELVESLSDSSAEFAAIVQSEPTLRRGHSPWIIKAQDEARMFVRSQIDVEGADIFVTVLTGFEAQAAFQLGGAPAEVAA
jgi:hypothetical protein